MNVKKKRLSGNKFFAVLLASVMMFSTVQVPAFAENTVSAGSSVVASAESVSDGAAVSAENASSAGSSEDSALSSSESAESSSVQNPESTAVSDETAESASSEADVSDNSAADESVVGLNTVIDGVDYSPVFDFDYYINRYPAMKLKFASDPQGALNYFITEGIKRGQQACDTFNIVSYFYANADLRDLYGDDYSSYLLHYLNKGKSEGRTAIGVSEPVGSVTMYNGVDYSSVFDFQFYMNKYPALQAKYGKDDAGALAYFVTTGVKAHQQASASFDVYSYYLKYQDIRITYGKDYSKALNHYLTQGKKEGRTAVGVTQLQNPVTTYNGKSYAQVYDFNYYMSKNPTVKKTYYDDDIGALKYWVTTGIKSGQIASSKWDVRSYYLKYQNLRKTYKKDYAALLNHYLTTGMAAGYTAAGITTLQNPVMTYNGIDFSSVYDFYYYTNSYTDLKKAYGDDDFGAIAHFANFAYKESRTGKSGVGPETATYKAFFAKLNDYDYRLALSTGSATQYFITVNKSTHIVKVYQRTNGNWGTSPVLSTSCTIGKPSTPTYSGTFRTRLGGYYFDSGLARCFYYTPFNGGIYFHSVLYYQDSTPRRIMDGRLGMNISHGCVRLPIGSAQWIYEHIGRAAPGTTVVVYG